VSLRTRLVAVCAVLLFLIAALVLGIVFSPDRVQARTAGRALLPLSSSEEITGVEIAFHGGPVVALARGPSGWKAVAGGKEYPASADRLQSFLHTVTGLTRGKKVSRDAGHFPELGLSDDTAWRLLLHRSASRPELVLLVGKRGPSGDEDYVRVAGEGAAYLVRGSLAFFLSQGPSYWYELHVLPDDVMGTTVARVTVRGSLQLAGPEPVVVQGPYTLERAPGAQSAEWTIDGQPANRLAAGAMAGALSLLEGDDFADAPVGEAGEAAGRRVDIEVATLEGKKYELAVSQDPASGKLLVTTSWSPWTYIVNPVLLQRAVRPRSMLQAR
jgi:hypothetical protein